jgi:pimeloyl-ACP methyl ester carboxylesterase
MQKKLCYQSEHLYYEQHGQGKPIILIHGFGEDASIWESTTKLLSQHATVYTIHLPGTGLNITSNPQLATINDCAQILAGLYKAENLETALIVGHSMGGYIALAFAKNNAEQVTALGLVHSSVFADDDAKKEARAKNMVFIANNGTEAFIKQSTPNLFAPTFVDEHKLWLQNYIQSLYYMAPQVLINYTESMKNRADSADWIKETAIPILYIIGDADKAIPFEKSMQQCHLPNISYIHILKNVGHMGMFEANKCFNQYINAFVLNQY